MKQDPIVPNPGPQPGEKKLSVSLSEYAHYEGRTVFSHALAHGWIAPDQTLAYRVTGFEYRRVHIAQDCYDTYPCLLLAVLPIDDIDNRPEGWNWTNGD